MKTDIEIFKQTPLFHNISGDDLETVVGCLDGIKRHYKKGTLILSEGEPQKRIGVILSGCIQISSEDVFGNRNIMEQLETGDMYGAAFACAGIKKSPVNVTAVQDSTMWFADVEKVLTVCPHACPFHQLLVKNMVYILARKNVALNEKIEHISRRSTREKLLSYLSGQAKKEGRQHFVIPFNRQELADYLCVDRSAMSTELGRLKEEGLIRFNKSQFWINGI